MMFEILDYYVLTKSGSNAYRRSPRSCLAKGKTSKYAHQLPLQHLGYSVFGLGSRAYPNFCAFSHFINDTLDSLGATRIYSIGEGDELYDQEESFKNWAKNAFQVACNCYNIGDYLMRDALDLLDGNNTSLVYEKFKLVPANFEDCISPCDELSKVFNKKVYSCTVKEKTRLGYIMPSRQTILVKIDLGEKRQSLAYCPGDHVLVYPHNPSILVHALIEQLHDVPPADQLVKSEFVDADLRRAINGNEDAYNYFRCFPACTLEEIFTRFLDITTPPSQELLNILSSQAVKSEDKLKIKRLACVNGTIHQGVCSNWLNSISFGDKIHCSVRKSNLFHLPSVPTLPVIMVGPGTGIAPFRSFWMQRKICKKRQSLNEGGRKIRRGEMNLYFGCRTAGDNLLRDELQIYEKEGVLTRCYFAFSREPGVKRTYVQDLLKRNGQDVYSKVVVENGHFYICGNIQMDSDVEKTLHDIIQTFGKMSSSAADVCLHTLKKQNRFHEDIFGLKIRRHESDNTHGSI